MDSWITFITVVANIFCIYGGFCYIREFCHEEEREMKEYRKMTDLSIRMLNQKIEKSFHSIV
jgi:hypothetical protein